MKKLLLLISFSILSLYSFTQIDVQRDSRVNPILKRAVTPNGGYITFGRTDPSRLINIAVLNQSSHVISWFTCHGRLFDSTKLTNSEFEQVTQKQLDPFGLYQNITDKYLTVITAVKDIYRVNGDIPIGDSLNAGYYALSSLESIRKAKTPLQKLIAVENIRKNILTQRAYLNCANPFRLKNDLLFTAGKELAGVMIKTEDSTIYYNIDPTSAINKIGLYKKSPEILYIYSRLSELIDSIPVLPGKYDLLLQEKSDVFLLYRGWLELQWQSTISAIKRQTSSFNTNEAQGYSQVNLREERAIKKELYSQLHAIETKINLLISPDEKSIEQVVYETYKNEKSEINYIPLLGIGYNLTQTRGLKEYELTNHLGNALAIISDRKIGVSSAADSSLIDHYEADIVSAQDYYPFGMLHPGRSYLSSNADRYRYGFNGKENDNEVKGEGNQQDYGMRVYDPRIGRFLSVDPLTKEYPHYTPYSYAGNKPIKYKDRDGEEEEAVAVFAGPPGWVYIGAKWVLIGTATLYSAYIVGQAAEEIKDKKAGNRTPTLLDKPVTTQPTVNVPKIKPTPITDSNKKPDPLNPFPSVPPFGADNDDDDDQYIYRGGNPGDGNLTPRPERDTKGPKRGLSTFTTAAEAKEKSGKKTATKLSVKSLRAQGLTVDFIGTHASIRPATQKELDDWAATKQDAVNGKGASTNTKKVQAAVKGIE